MFKPESKITIKQKFWF